MHEFQIYLALFLEVHVKQQQLELRSPDALGLLRCPVVSKHLV